MLRKSNRLRSINDKQIIEDLILVEYPSAKSVLNTLYSRYLEILEVRDAIVHLSPFKDDDSKRSRIELTLYYSVNQVAEINTTCYHFVKTIDGLVNQGMLFWKTYMSDPNFKSLTLISNLNSARDKLDNG